jgi:hypothetical protein
MSGPACAVAALNRVLIAVIALLAFAYEQPGTSHAAGAGQTGADPCLRNPSACLPNSGPHGPQPWYIGLRVRSMNCERRTIQNGPTTEEVVRVTAHVVNTANRAIVLPEGAPNLDMAATAFSIGAGTLQPLDSEANGFPTPITFAAPVVPDPAQPPVYDDHRITFDFPLAKLRRPVNQIEVQFANRSGPGSIVPVGQPTLASIRLYWPGGADSRIVAGSTPLDLNNPACNASVQL